MVIFPVLLLSSLKSLVKSCESENSFFWLWGEKIGKMAQVGVI